MKYLIFIIFIFKSTLLYSEILPTPFGINLNNKWSDQLYNFSRLFLYNNGSDIPIKYKPIETVINKNNVYRNLHKIYQFEFKSNDYEYFKENQSLQINIFDIIYIKTIDDLIYEIKAIKKPSSIPLADRNFINQNSIKLNSIALNDQKEIFDLTEILFNKYNFKNNISEHIINNKDLKNFIKNNETSVSCYTINQVIGCKELTIDRTINITMYTENDIGIKVLFNLDAKNNKFELIYKNLEYNEYLQKLIFKTDLFLGKEVNKKDGYL